MRMLVVEDNERDLCTAVDVARSVGFSNVAVKRTVTSAREFLEYCLAGEARFPDAIVLDLDLGYESGYELLRFWSITPPLAHSYMVVWSLLPEENCEVCVLFKPNAFVCKWEGPAALHAALEHVKELHAVTGAPSDRR
jgi:CheY-like chemotaxis protein